MDGMDIMDGMDEGIEGFPVSSILFVSSSHGFTATGPS
jgi:hypothetical protein